MGERVLQDPILVAAGVAEPARRIGSSEASVSNWPSAPTERVLSVEAVMDVARTILWPDVDVEQPAEINEIDAARAQKYALLSALLVRAPNVAFLKKLSTLRGDASPLGVAHVALAQAAADGAAEQIDREYFDLFIGIGRGEIVPYASFYLTGFLHERPLARLRNDLSGMGIDRADSVAEPEDHAGILCEIMAGLASGELPAPGGSDRLIFERHMAPWIGRFFSDIETAAAARFYRHVGTFGRLFVQIETEAFALVG